jgi:hypothetical protein
MFRPTVFRVVLALFVFSALAMAAPSARASLMTQFDFVSEPSGTQAGAYIEFKGGPARTVTFPNGASGYDFVITQSDAPSMIGIKGNIDGTFTVGQITTVGSLQTAPLNGTGTFFRLTDPSGKVLSADLTWKEIFTYGTGGGLNPDPMNTINLTNWNYDTGGSYQPFLDILGGADQSVSLSFQFSPGKTLTQLMATGSDRLTTYAGSFSMTPEPATLCLLGVGAAVALISRRKKR